VYTVGTRGLIQQELKRKLLPVPKNAFNVLTQIRSLSHPCMPEYLFFEFFFGSQQFISMASSLRRNTFTGNAGGSFSFQI
jgi:hypothetical protein